MAGTDMSGSDIGSHYSHPDESDTLKDQDRYPIDKINRLRSIVQNYMKQHQYSSALYWADKLVSLSGEEPEDMYILGLSLLLNKHYRRASNLLESRQLYLRHLGCCFVTAKSLFLSGELEQALLIIEEAQKFLADSVEKLEDNMDSMTKDEEDCTRSQLSNIYLLKGQIFETLDNRAEAAENFKKALMIDIFCYEAFESLVQHQMLSAKDEKDLINDLPFHEQDDTEIVQHLYLSSLKKYECPDAMELPGELESLEDNHDVQVSLAERHYYNCDYSTAYAITSDIMDEDPFHTRCLPIHVGLMVELQKTNELFRLAHRLVEVYPEWSVAWYAVGCYYFATGKQDPARRYLSKATQLDRLFGPAWMAYGHSFAVDNEHDQAMAAYFKACQLMRGCHLPLLYIGLEYSLTNNQNFAERFFNEALEIAPNDPFVLHELGVLAYNYNNFASAERYFNRALTKIRVLGSQATIKNSVNGCRIPEKWESLLTNLGHTMRKLGRYEDALNFHREALLLSPVNASTYSAIGFVQALMRNLNDSVESFHKALGIRPEDTFSTNMLNDVIQQLMTEVAPFPNYPTETPWFKITNGQNVSGETSKGLQLDEDDLLEDDDDVGADGAMGSSEGAAGGLENDLDDLREGQMVMRHSHQVPELKENPDTSLSSELTPTPAHAMVSMNDPASLMSNATDSQHTLADASNLSIDCDMEEPSSTRSGTTELDMDLTN